MSVRTTSTTVVAMREDHAAAVLAIYQAGLDAGDASFAIAAPAWADWDAEHLPDHRFVALGQGVTALGWVALSPVSDRCAYAGVAEVSVYVHPDAQGRGVGRRLLQECVDSAETGGLWTLQAGIFPENAASVHLHERSGFRVVGCRERLGRHHGRWRDVLLLERRSTVTGRE